MNKIATEYLPVSLGKCPIVDAVVEVRFTPTIFRQAVFGLAYERLKGKFPKVEQLPILQLPQGIIDNDQNLKSKPHYKLTGDSKFAVNVGPDVISISPIMPTSAISTYPGWSLFHNAIIDVFQLVDESRVIEVVDRVGIRYTNFFHNKDIFKKLNLEIFYNNELLPYKKTVLKTDIELGGFQSTLQLSNDATRQTPSESQFGSIIDIDTFKSYKPGESIDRILSQDINTGHEVEKQIFWDLLSEEFKAELLPTFRT